LVRKSLLCSFGQIPVLQAEGSILRGMEETYLINILGSLLSSSWGIRPGVYATVRKTPRIFRRSSKMFAFTLCEQSEHNKYVNRTCYLEFRKQISGSRLIYSLWGEHINICLTGNSSLFIPLPESMKFSYVIAPNFFTRRSS
jgi:hypothetical protein